MTSRQELLETFPLALTGVKSSSGNFFFYTSSLAFKFLHKEICPLATQVLSVATTRKILRIFLIGITTRRSKTGSSRQMTQTAMKGCQVVSPHRLVAPSYVAPT